MLGAMAETPRTFEEFWPFYVRAHTKKASRTLHFIGTTGALALVSVGVLTRRPLPILMAPVVGYGFAWVGHFFIEGNIPATFGNPLWSLKGDFKMWRMMLEGTMDAEVERILAADQGQGVPESDPAVNVAPDPTIN
jgi:hypothetical protein